MKFRIRLNWFFCAINIVLALADHTAPWCQVHVGIGLFCGVVAIMLEEKTNVQ